MKQHRKNCNQCGKEFQAFTNAIGLSAKLCIKKCAIAWCVRQGIKWESKLWKPRAKKTWTTKEKMEYACKI